MADGPTHYEILGLDQDAPTEEIKRRYRELSKRYHRDTGGSDALFRQIQEAYQTLRDSDLRGEYDESLARRSRGSPRDRSGGAGSTSRDNGQSRPGPRPEDRQTPPDGGSWPVTWGTAAGGIEGLFGRYGRGAASAGGRGERATAERLGRAGLSAGTFVLHDLTPRGGDGNVDHVVVVGDTLFAIDSKCWAPGRYETYTEQAERIDPQRGEAVIEERPVTLRNGLPFEPGLARSTAFLSERLAHSVEWSGPVHPVLCVHSSDGDDRHLDLEAFSVEGVEVLRGDDLSDAILTAEGNTRSDVTPAAALAKLVAATTTPEEVLSPYRPTALPAITVPLPAARHVRPVLRAFASLLIFAAALSVIVVALGWFSVGVERGSGDERNLVVLVGLLAAAGGLLGRIAGEGATGRVFTRMTALAATLNSILPRAVAVRSPRVARPRRLVLFALVWTPLFLGVRVLTLHGLLGTWEGAVLAAVALLFLVGAVRAWLQPHGEEKITARWVDASHTVLSATADAPLHLIPVCVAALAEAIPDADALGEVLLALADADGEPVVRFAELACQQISAQLELATG